MMKAKLGAVVAAICLMLATPWFAAGAPAPGPEVPRLAPGILKTWLGSPQVIVLDVRQPASWQLSHKKIKGAWRREPQDVKTWAAALPKDKKIVLYCA